eukprot:scaffold43425_cov57-Attheya_sp.AAC.1
MAPQQMEGREKRRSGTLSIERKARLNVIGFSLSTINFDAWWETSYDDLVDYKKVNGHTNVLVARSGTFSSWVSTQRKAEKNGTLSSEQKAILNVIGFSWNPKDCIKPRSVCDPRISNLWDTSTMMNLLHSGKKIDTQMST